MSRPQVERVPFRKINLVLAIGLVVSLAAAMFQIWVANHAEKIFAHVPLWLEHSLMPVWFVELVCVCVFAGALAVTGLAWMVLRIAARTRAVDSWSDKGDL